MYFARSSSSGNSKAAICVFFSSKAHNHVLTASFRGLAKTVFRQICKILPIDKDFSISAYVSVCVSVAFVQTGRTLAKIKNVKDNFCRF